ncbi:LacI family DNA-binding transcriptional regulator [Microbacterium halophytorum]|uniref:LacI family DNA-binding transcriptional regulator n=1 Tax=Microbacterium halophytorum TaxID=2067568 RepID=UPI000CFCB97F|nr:LacI family DNA-binding transcriptional regulator [Microbacterium halophytorum]
MATLSDVAARAGVSVSAVSRVLSNAPDARVGDETRERILRAAEELSYRPNHAARALKLSRTNVVALIVPDLTNALFTELMRGVDDEAARHGYTVMLARAERIEEDPEALRRMIGEGRVDGVLLHPGDAPDEDALRPVLEGGLPVLVINAPGPEGTASVALDDAEGAAVATRHLLGLGHRRIGFLGGSEASPTAPRREAGYAAALAEAGVALDESIVTRIGYVPRAGGEALAAVMDAAEPPTAVVVANVNAAIGALLEARRRGIAVPEELSIVTIHDAWTAESTWPPLTAVRMPQYEMGQAAMRRLVARLGDGRSGGPRAEPAGPEQTLIDEPAPLLIIRESTAPPAVWG